MNGNEHRDVGDAATGAATVNLGGESAGERFSLGYGDVMALSGDYFVPDPSGRTTGPLDGDLAAGNLFELARIPGHTGNLLGSRDELICALRVMTIDEGSVDPRFEPGGSWAAFGSDRSDRATDVERRVRDRYLVLAATNDDHFLDPGGVTHVHRSAPRSHGSAVIAYRRLHELALEEACRTGRLRGDQSTAFAREAAAQHFLTDAFTAGHIRTPVAQIRRFWRARYPDFWEAVQRKVATTTASTLREMSWALRGVSERFVEEATLSTVRSRTGRYPPLSLGDFLARLFHDWDNIHGLAIEGGGVVFGDGHVHEGDTRNLAIAAVRAGIDDIEVALEIGARGGRLTGEPLYRAVRAATGRSDDLFRAQSLIPRPASTNAPQNWRAGDIEILWDRPIVGGTGTTVGQALTEMLRPDGTFIRQLDRLGRGLAAHGLLAVPILGKRLARTSARAYHRGFVAPLAAHPRREILSVVHPTAPDVQLTPANAAGAFAVANPD